MAAAPAGLGCGFRNHAGSVGQSLAALPARRNRLLWHGRDQPFHDLLPRAHLRHRAGGAAALNGHVARGQPPPGRVLCAHRLWRGGHVPAHRRGRIAAGFIALEISSIATYILAGYRKETGRGPEAAIKYFLLGSFATGFLLYGIALIFGATGTTQIYEICPPCAHARRITPSSWREWR